MRTLEYYDYFAAAYALSSGVTLLKVTTNPAIRYVLDDSEGQASKALDEWCRGRALVNAKRYASAVRHLQHIRMAAA